MIGWILASLLLTNLLLWRIIRNQILLAGRNSRERQAIINEIAYLRRTMGREHNRKG